MASTVRIWHLLLKTALSLQILKNKVTKWKPTILSMYVCFVNRHSKHRPYLNHIVWEFFLESNK